MVLITEFLANMIFMMYRDRFGAYDFVDMVVGEDILLPHGVHFVKTDINKYGIKYYAWDMRDWKFFKEGLTLRILEIVDAHTQIHPDLAPKVKENPDGSASFVGELIGMGL
ncbi:MAG: hypothetical protein PVG39_31505 [Desulfobacteraceae bacterium]|jgi:hypothetical protein